MRVEGIAGIIAQIVSEDLISILYSSVVHPVCERFANLVVKRFHTD